MASSAVFHLFNRNAVFALAQAILTLLCVFGAYRILVQRVGIEHVGIWSFLTAVSALSRMADVTGSGALVRFVAREHAIGFGGDVKRYVHTITLTTIALYAAVSILLFFLAPALIRSFVDLKYVREAVELVPLALLILLTGTVVTTLLSSIDGLQRADQRAILAMASVVLMFALAIVLVPSHGLMGFAVAQLCQQVFLIVGAWLILRWHRPELGFFPTQFDRPTFFESTSYGLKVQAAGIAALFFEPLARLVLGTYGGMAVLGQYELASRLVTQARGLIVAGAQPLTATFAATGQFDREKLGRQVAESTRVIATLSAAVILGILVLAPFVGWFIAGTVQTEFLYMVAMLAGSWGINTIAVPIYFAGMGCGILRWNITSHVVIGLVTVVTSLIFAPLIGVWAIVLGVVCGLLFGTITVIIGNSYALGLSSAMRTELVYLVSVALIIFALAASFAALIPQIIVFSMKLSTSFVLPDLSPLLRSHQ